MAFYPQPQPGGAGSALLQHLEYVGRQGGWLTGGQDQPEAAIHVFGRGLTDHSHMPDLLKQETIDGQVAVCLKDSFLSLEIGASSRLLATEANSPMIEAAANLITTF